MKSSYHVEFSGIPRQSKFTRFSRHIVLSVECRKMTCDVTKVTYNTYSCNTCCMSREMMKMKGRDSAKCRKSKLGDIYGIIEFVLNEEKDKIRNRAIFPKLKETKMGRRGRDGK